MELRFESTREALVPQAVALVRRLREAGFVDVRTYGDCRRRAPREDEQRIYFSAIRGK